MVERGMPEVRKEYALEREGPWPPCPEAQADGVPCPELGRDCEDCERADPSYAGSEDSAPIPS